MLHAEQWKGLGVKIMCMNLIALGDHRQATKGHPNWFQVVYKFNLTWQITLQTT